MFPVLVFLAQILREKGSFLNRLFSSFIIPAVYYLLVNACNYGLGGYRTFSKKIIND